LSERPPPHREDPEDPVPPWPLITSRVLHEFSIYRLRQDVRRSPRTGKEHPFLVLDSTDWVNIVPVTPQGNIVLIRQFRHGTASVVWEIPGGMVDAEDRTPEHAARRELLEETGYRAERVDFLGVVHPNPAIQNNRCHSFVAHHARSTGSQHLDGSEDISVQEVPWPRVLEMIRSGEITHSLVITALFWYERHLASLPPPPLLP
jgi:ADP-ribose pyrophosphatase